MLLGLIGGLMENFGKLWAEYVKNQSKQYDSEEMAYNFGKGERTFARVKERIIDASMDLLECGDFMPLSLTCANESMTNFQKLIYLIEQADKKLFGGQGYFSTIVCDEYDVKFGLSGLLEIVSHFATLPNIAV